MTGVKEQQFNKRESQRRTFEQDRDVRLGHLGSSQLMREHVTSMHRVGQKGAYSGLAGMSGEHGVAEGLDAQMSKVEKLRQAAEIEQKLSETLLARKKAAESERLRVQRIHRESHELQALASKLKAAEMNQERNLQVGEKAAIREREVKYNAAIEQRMEEERRRVEEAEIQKEREVRLRNMVGKDMLVEQMHEKELARQAAEEQYHAERAVVDGIMAKIRAEDEADQQLKARRVNEYREIIAQAQREREDYLNAERQRNRDEDAAIKAFQDRKNAEFAAQQAAKKAVEQEASRVYQIIAAKKLKEERAREELLDLINDYYFQQQMIRDAEAKERDAEKKRRAVQDMKESYAEQAKAREQRKRERAEEEARIKAAVLAKFAEDEALERLNAETRAAEKAQFMRDVEQIKQDKRRMYEAQMEFERAQLAHAQAMQDAQDALVEQERQKIIAEAAKYEGFKPKGI